MSIVFRFKVPDSGQHLHKYPKSMHVQKLNQSKWKEFNLRQFIFIFIFVYSNLSQFYCIIRVWGELPSKQVIQKISANE